MKIRKSILIASCLFGFAIVATILPGCHQGSNTKESSESAEEIYTCPMHPQIIEHEPGNCPICGMQLVKKENVSREISTVDLSSVLQSNNNRVLSSIPVTTMQFARQQIPLEAFGIVEYDTRSMKTISSRVSGRIEKLYIKYRYQPVRAGDKIMDIYSPELLTAQQNLLFIIKNDPSNTSLIRAAKQRLLLQGMSNRQLQKMISSGKVLNSVTVYSDYSGHVHETGSMNYSRPVNADNQPLSVKEGMYVEKGQPVFQVNNMNHIWVSLNFFPGQNALVKVGTPVTLVAESAPDKKILSRIGFIEPFYKNTSKTMSARVYLDNSEFMMPVGIQVKASLQVNTGFSNWLPKEAVLSLGLNKVVFLKKGNVFKAQQVSTGVVSDHLIQVLQGLNPKDSVAENAQFLIDSEGFIKVKDSL